MWTDENQKKLRKAVNSLLCKLFGIEAKSEAKRDNALKDKLDNLDESFKENSSKDQNKERLIVELKKLRKDIKKKHDTSQNNKKLIAELVMLIDYRREEPFYRHPQIGEKLLYDFLGPYGKLGIINGDALRNFLTTHLDIKTRVQRIFSNEQIGRKNIKTYPTIYSIITKSGDVPPSTNMDALDAWKNAWARLVAYTWLHWEWDESKNQNKQLTELDFIKLYPEYYLQQFGFDVNDWPQFRNAIKVVIHNNDTVTYVNQGAIYIHRPDEQQRKDNADALTPKDFEASDWENVFDLPAASEYLSNEDDPDVMVSINPLLDEYKKDKCVQDPVEFLKKKFPWFKDNQQRTNDTINEDGENRLRNGWENNNWGYLMGMIVAPIPYPPRVPMKEAEITKIEKAVEKERIARSKSNQDTDKAGNAGSGKDKAIDKVKSLFGIPINSGEPRSPKKSSNKPIYLRTTPEIIAIKKELTSSQEDGLGLDYWVGKLVHQHDYELKKAKAKELNEGQSPDQGKKTKPEPKDLTKHEAIALTDYMQMVHNQPFSTDAC